MEQEAPGGIVISRDDGEIYSFSSLDRGEDPASVIHHDIDDAVIGIYRRALGDIAFIVRRGRGGTVNELYYVPEYPSEHLGEWGGAVSCYGFPLFDKTQRRASELRLSDPAYRVIGWDAAMSLIEKRDLKEFNEIQQMIVETAKEIDDRFNARHQHNVNAVQMRRSVGPARGARVYTRLLMFS